MLKEIKVRDRVVPGGEMMITEQFNSSPYCPNATIKGELEELREIDLGPGHEESKLKEG